MIDKTFPMKFLDAKVLGINFFAVPNEGDDLRFDYPIDIDLNIGYEDGNIFYMQMEIITNKSAKPGYSYSIFCEGKFVFNPGTQKDQIDNYLMGPAIKSLIEFIRNYIMEITSRSVYGTYILPYISVRKVINKYQRKIAKYEDDKKQK